MLEERPPAELPARASASAGASARVAAINTASKMRQFSSRYDMAEARSEVREKVKDTHDMGTWLGRRKDYTRTARMFSADRGSGAKQAGLLDYPLFCPNIRPCAQWL